MRSRCETPMFHNLTRQFLLLAVLLFTAACGQDVLPIDDLCVAETPEQCTPCATDADCVIGGDPCCHPQFRYYCGHTILVDAIGECTAECVVDTPRPDDTFCRCIEGQCHGG